MTLTRADRKAARDRATAAALLGLEHAASIHYTQSASSRWEGIEKRLVAAEGAFPRNTDCSAFVTWCLWNAMHTAGLQLPDEVNGQDWKSGYTGTMAQNGKVIANHHYAVRGDAVLYGDPIYHTAILVGRKDGQLVAVSHGEESGPYLVPYDAWPVNEIRRYII
jgi:cell wall-associated NlpC family hydrolase